MNLVQVGIFKLPKHWVLKWGTATWKCDGQIKQNIIMVHALVDTFFYPLYCDEALSDFITV